MSTEENFAGLREIGILFRGSMVRAIIAGTKTQTRRVIKPQPQNLPMTDGDTWFDVKTVLDRVPELKA